MAWYIREAGKEAGPFSIADLSERVVARRLAIDDFVRAERRDIWQPAASIIELAAFFDSIQPDPPSNIQPSELSTSFDDPRTKLAATPRDPIESRKKSKRFFLIRHWRGQLPLSVSFWVIGIAAPLAMGLLHTIVDVVLDRQDIDIHLYGIISFLVDILAPINAVWVLVGIYRSAERYQDNGGSAIWAGLTRLCMILQGIVLAIALITFTWPTGKESALLAVGIDRIPPYQLKLLPGGKELELSGGLSFGTAHALEAMLSAHPDVRTLHLNSPGGRLREAILIDRLMRKNNIDTYTATECDSACTLIFVYGKRRYLANGARLGFHSTGLIGSTYSYAAINLTARQLYAAAGLPSAFISHALATPNTDVWYPRYDELRAAHVIDAVVDAGSYASSSRTSVGNWGALDSQMVKIPLLAKLKRYDPWEYNFTVWEAKYAVRKGVPPAEIAQSAVAFFETRLLPSHIAAAPDQSVLQFAHVIVDQLRYIGANNPQHCQGILQPGGKTRIDLDVVFPAEMQRSSIDSLESLVEESALHPYTTPPDDNLRSAVKGAFKAYFHDTPKAVALFRNPQSELDHPEESCKVVADLYDMLLSEDDQEESAAILRFILAQEK